MTGNEGTLYLIIITYDGIIIYLSQMWYKYKPIKFYNVILGN